MRSLSNCFAALDMDQGDGCLVLDALSVLKTELRDPFQDLCCEVNFCFVMASFENNLVSNYTPFPKVVTKS